MLCNLVWTRWVSPVWLTMTIRSEMISSLKEHLSQIYTVIQQNVKQSLVSLPQCKDVQLFLVLYHYNLYIFGFGFLHLFVI